MWCYRTKDVFNLSIIGKLRCHNHSNINWILKQFCVWLLCSGPMPGDNTFEIRVICIYLRDSCFTHSRRKKRGSPTELFFATQELCHHLCSNLWKCFWFTRFVTLWFWCVITPLCVLRRISIVQKKLIPAETIVGSAEPADEMYIHWKL